MPGDWKDNYLLGWPISRYSLKTSIRSGEGKTKLIRVR
jgi:hypothetical protein